MTELRLDHLRREQVVRLVLKGDDADVVSNMAFSLKLFSKNNNKLLREEINRGAKKKKNNNNRMSLTIIFSMDGHYT